MDAYTYIANTQTITQNIFITPENFPVLPSNQIPSTRKETTIRVSIIVGNLCCPFACLYPDYALVSRNKMLWPLAHLWWFHTTLEFKSTFFFKALLKTNKQTNTLLVYSFSTLLLPGKKKSFSYPSTLWPDWNSLTGWDRPPGSGSREGGGPNTKPSSVLFWCLTKAR